MLTGQTPLTSTWNGGVKTDFLLYISFALNRISLKHFPFLYEISRGSLNIS